MKQNKLFQLLYCCLGLAFFTSANAQTFEDVPTTHPYYAAVEALVSQEIINGYPDGTFKPDKAINRVETLKVLLLSADLALEETTYNAGFPDIVSNSWYSKYVVRAKNDGIVKGNPDGFFYPNNQVNFAEALKIICLTNQIELSTSITTAPFLDVPSNSWFAPYFEYAKNNNIIQKQSNENAFPSTLLTRAEVAELVFRFQEAEKAEVKVQTQFQTETQSFATYYADLFQGRTTASGEIFDQEKLTAAHKTLAFGTNVKVTNLENNQSVIVRINDRGPYANNPNYALDLSRSAFQSIAPLSRGVIQISYEIIEESPVTEKVEITEEEEEEVIEELATEEVEIIEEEVEVIQNKVFEVNAKCTKEYERNVIKNDFYDDIILNQDIPTVFLKNEVYLIKGRLETSNSSASVVTVFVVAEDGDENRFEGEIENSDFSIPVIFKDVGKFNVGLLLGESGKSYIQQVEVISEDCFGNIDIEATVPDNLNIKIKNNQTEITWNNKGQRLSKIDIWQGDNTNTYILNNNQDSFELPYADFENFSNGKVYYRVSSALSNSDFSIDRNSEWVASQQEFFSAVKHHQIFNNLEEVQVNNLPSEYSMGQTIAISGTTYTDIMQEASIILPTGLITTLDLTGDKITTNSLNKKIIPTGNNFYLNYKPDLSGTQIIEINADNGFAVVNIPVYQQGFIPLIPDLWDINPPMAPESVPELDSEKSSAELHALVNKTRQEHGLNTVRLDTSLNQLAQFRVNDMLANDYFAHENLDGKYVNDFRLEFGIKVSVSENIAKVVDVELAHEGLMRSAIHRDNILKGEWTRVGIGLGYTNDGYLIATEVFAEDPFSQDDLPEMRSQILENINQNRETADLLSSPILNEISQNWSEEIVNENYWFDNSETGISLSYLITQEITDKQTASTILKGDFGAILENIHTNETFTESRWKTLGVGISQNDSGTLNITLIYSE